MLENYLVISLVNGNVICVINCMTIYSFRKGYICVQQTNLIYSEYISFPG